MGFSLSATWAILGASLIVIIELVATAFFPAVAEIENAESDIGSRLLERLNTNFVLENFSWTANSTNYDGTFQINNTGETTIDLSGCQLLLDGVVVPFQYSTQYIFPKDLQQIDLENVSISENALVKVVTNNGRETYQMVYVGGT